MNLRASKLHNLVSFSKSQIYSTFKLAVINFKRLV